MRKKRIRGAVIVLLAAAVFGTLCYAAGAASLRRMLASAPSEGSRRLLAEMADARSDIAQFALLEETPSGVENYVEAVSSVNTALAGRRLRNIVTTVTFSRYLSFDELGEYVEEYSLSVRAVTARSFDETGMRATMYTPADGGLGSVEDTLLRQAEQYGYDFAGVCSVKARVDSAQLAALISDERTYLADTTGDAAFRTGAFAANGAVRNLNPLTSWYPHPLTWTLEDLGLVGPAG